MWLYLDYGNSYKATVMKYNGSAWVLVGSAGFSAGRADYTNLVFAPDGTPYVAYADRGNGGKATVMKFSGSSWAAVGSAFSTAGAMYTSLAFAPDGTPYVAYSDSNSSYKATVMKYNGSAWATGGERGFLRRFSQLHQPGVCAGRHAVRGVFGRQQQLQGDGNEI